MRTHVELSIADLREARQDLAKLDNATDSRGRLNLTYGDGYFAASLERKYHVKVDELRKLVRKHLES